MRLRKGDFVDKNYIQNLTRGQLLETIDEDVREYVDLHEGVSSIEEAWLIEESLHDYDKSRFEKEVEDIEDERFKRFITKRGEDVAESQWLEVYFTYHHLNLEEKPYWKQCIERIEEKL